MFEGSEGLRRLGSTGRNPHEPAPNQDLPISSLPVLAAILLPVMVAMFVVMWLTIPFGLIKIQDGRIKWDAPWGKE